MTIPIPSLRFPTLWLIGIFIGLTVALPGLAAEEPAPRLPAEAVCLGDLYAGTLDNHLAIRLSLVRQGEQLDGTIYYEKDEQYDAGANRYQSLRLEGKVDKDGRFVLTESDPGKEAESRVTGRFTGAFDTGGKASGTWETPAGDQKLSFHVNPTDSLEQGRNPPYRLRFEPARVWLSIEGGKETLLTGPDNEAAFPCFPSEQFLEHENRFNPESMHVRKLNGQPDLYWMSYDIKSQDWRGYQVDRRHRVVRASNPEQSLFDEWTEEVSKSGSGNVYADWSEDYGITHQGATLRIVNAKSYDSGYGDNDDCVTCVEEHENCPAFCEGFVCTLPSTESMERCEEVCLRNCESKDWVEECYAGKETQKPYLRKRIREIDVQTGLVKSDHRFQLNDFIPGWYRCSGKALHFYVLDDGISSWLLVRDQTLFGQNGETPKPTPFDPENPGQIPAIATCWLYTSLYENLKAGQDEEEAGRLLAIFDGSSQNCFSASLLKDGRWGKALVKSIAPHERITLGSGVRLRTGPYSSAREIARRVSIGTVVLVLGRSAFTTRIDGVEDRWYYVAEPKGVYGWAFGGLLAPFDSSHPEKAYRQIVERYLASKTHGPAEEADFQAFLGRLRAELPKPVVEAEEGKDDPRRLLTRFDEHMQACRTPHRAQDGRKNPIQVESVAPHKRITLGSGVRLRHDPESGCGQLDRLPLGTVVSVRKRTVSPSHVDGAEDRWYQVETPSGATGWVFGGLLLPFDQAHPEQAYREIVERHLASEAGTLREEVEFLEFLARVCPNLSEALVPDFELARLRGIARALGHFPFHVPLEFPPPLDAPWMAEQLAGLEPYVGPMADGAPHGLDPGAYWALHERYRAHPAAERLAWAAAQAPLFGEGCEGDPVCEIESLPEDDFVRYVRFYPSGAHASEAVDKIAVILEQNLTAAMGGKPEIACHESFRKGLQAALEILLPVKGAQAAAARERINALLGACPSVGAAAQPAPASGTSTAQPIAQAVPAITADYYPEFPRPL